MRCKAILALFMLCILAAGSTLTAVPTPEDHTTPSAAKPAALSRTMSFTFSPPEISSRDSYCTIGVAEATSHTRNSGAPLLPQCNEVIHLPAGTHVTDITVQIGEVHTTQLTSHLLPALTPAAIGQPATL